MLLIVFWTDWAIAEVLADILPDPFSLTVGTLRLPLPSEQIWLLGEPSNM